MDERPRRAATNERWRSDAMIVEPITVVAKTLTLALGAVITWQALKGFRETRSRSILALAVGFGFMTLGAVLGGAVHQVTGIGFRGGVLVQSLLSLGGFSVITYSLYAE